MRRNPYAPPPRWRRRLRFVALSLANVVGFVVDRMGNTRSL